MCPAIWLDALCPEDRAACLAAAHLAVNLTRIEIKATFKWYFNRY